MNHAIDPALRRLVIAHGGDGRWRACPGSDGAVRVWAIRRPSGTVFLKSYPHGRGFRQELTALRDWGPALAGVPRILAVQAAPPALLLSQIDGSPGGTGTAADAAELHRRAGAWLARLHTLPHDDRDPLPLGQALSRRAATWLRRGQACFEPDLRERLAAAMRPLAGVHGPRVPCHRDFTPDNWLRQTDGIGVIDFEHARADCWLQDVVRLHRQYHLARPALATSFWQGYGRRPSSEECEHVHALAVLDTCATWIWAQQHGEADLAAASRRQLSHLLNGAGGTQAYLFD